MTKKTVLKWLFCLFGLYACVVLLTFFKQREMMYFPSGHVNVEESVIKNIKEVQIHTDDGLTLKSWYKPSEKKHMPTVISYHGNASNLKWQSERLAPFESAGYGILIASYRGYNGNKGKPTEEGLYADGRAHIKWLLEQGSGEPDIIIYGESIGTGVAVQMATEFKNINRLILESPFTSTVDVAALTYPFLPVRTLLKDRYENIRKIGDVKAPLIVAHGRQDKLFPFYMAKEIYERSNAQKNFIDVPQGGHGNLGSFGVTEKYLGILSE